jgi:predicted GNAT superfamily acetyltransferase
MEEIVIRECVEIDELDKCVRLQREVFGLPDLEISPRRHLIVSRQAGGWTLAAFAGGPNGSLVGFVHHLVALRANDEIIGYSHMMAVHPAYQNQGLGARLKLAQRERALAEGRQFIKWTWDPMQARNAHFNLNRLGAVVQTYAENFYGTDYVTEPELRTAEARGIDSDRLLATWQLSSKRVIELVRSARASAPPGAIGSIQIPADWNNLLKHDVSGAREEQLRVRLEFKSALAAGLVCAGFERAQNNPRYLLYKDSDFQG